MMRRLLFVLVGLAGLALAVAGRAGIEADPGKDYVINPEAGPWVICAACFVGPEAAKLAHEMILEIRTRHNLPAYLFDRSAEERRKQEEERRKQQQELERLHERYPEAEIPQRMRPRVTRVQEECAVLIGGYKDMDAASRALKQVKKLPPPSSERLMPLLTQMEPVGAPEEHKAQLKCAYANPFANSFVTRNPTVPQERPAPPKNDPIYKKLNAHEPYSLLKCPKPWTLVVATYQGLQIIEPKQADSPSLLEKLESLWKNNTGQMLDASAQNAHNLAEALRKTFRDSHLINYEAYVLHTRWGSVVTVGGFDRLDDPQMQQVQRVLANLKIDQAAGILPQPMPMEVPRP